MKSIFAYSGCFLSLAMASCLSDITPAGQAVRIGKMDPQSGCAELGMVYGSGGGGPYTTSEDKMRSAQNELRNNAAELGANYVAMDVAGGDNRSLTLTGRAFKCPPGGAQPEVAGAAPAATPEERLKKIQELRDKKLITDEEYESRRAEIVKSL